MRKVGFTDYCRGARRWRRRESSAIYFAIPRRLPRKNKNLRRELFAREIVPRQTNAHKLSAQEISSRREKKGERAKKIARCNWQAGVARKKEKTQLELASATDQQKFFHPGGEILHANSKFYCALRAGRHYYVFL